MTSEAVFHSWRPTAAQELLLEAALLKGQPAKEAWEEWIQRVDLARIDSGSHRLLPLLYQNLKAVGIDHPLWGRVRKSFVDTWASNQLLFANLRPLLTTLRGAGIDTLLLKGASLALRYYRSLGARPMSDLDILVPTKDALRAVATLQGSGWIPQLRSEKNLAAYAAVRHALPFFNPAGIELDLHWHVLNICISPDSDQDFWDGAIPVEVGGVHTKGLNPADELFHACIHAAPWNRVAPIRWVADAVTIVGLHGELDWDRLVEQAEKRNLNYTLSGPLTYVRHQFGAPIPPGALRALERIPLSALERRETDSRARDPGRAWGRRPFLWVYYPRIARDTGQSPSVLGLFRYLRAVWQLDSFWQVPLFALWMAARRIVGLPTEP